MLSALAVKPTLVSRDPSVALLRDVALVKLRSLGRAVGMAASDLDQAQRLFALMS